MAVEVTIDAARWGLSAALLLGVWIVLKQLASPRVRADTQRRGLKVNEAAAHRMSLPVTRRRRRHPSARRAAALCCYYTR